MAKNDTSTETAEAKTSVETETRYRVIVNTDAGPGGKGRFPIVVNGHISSLDRDVELQVTKAQYEVLKNAKIRGYELSEDGNAMAVPGRGRFSFSMLGEVEVPIGSLDTSPEIVSDGDAA